MGAASPRARPGARRRRGPARPPRRPRSRRSLPRAPARRCGSRACRRRGAGRARRRGRTAPTVARSGGRPARPPGRGRRSGHPRGRPSRGSPRRRSTRRRRSRPARGAPPPGPGGRAQVVQRVRGRGERRRQEDEPLRRPVTVEALPGERDGDARPGAEDERVEQAADQGVRVAVRGPGRLGRAVLAGRPRRRGRRRPGRTAGRTRGGRGSRRVATGPSAASPARSSRRTVAARSARTRPRGRSAPVQSVTPNCVSCGWRTYGARPKAAGCGVRPAPGEEAGRPAAEARPAQEAVVGRDPLRIELRRRRPVLVDHDRPAGARRERGLERGSVRHPRPEQAVGIEVRLVDRVRVDRREVEVGRRPRRPGTAPSPPPGRPSRS